VEVDGFPARFYRLEKDSPDNPSSCAPPDPHQSRVVRGLYGDSGVPQLYKDGPVQLDRCAILDRQRSLLAEVVEYQPHAAFLDLHIDPLRHEQHPSQKDSATNLERFTLRHTIIRDSTPSHIRKRFLLRGYRHQRGPTSSRATVHRHSSSAGVAKLAPSRVTYTVCQTALAIGGHTLLMALGFASSLQ
jgi:hypothetical protein